MNVYYNEIDPYCCQWLRNLIAAGHLPAGDVDDRDIREVSARDLDGYTSCHFFAGIGGWPHALRLAGWPDDRPVWTGSCPCPPFSSANIKRRRQDDRRHLAPHWLRLIDQCRPDTIFGEQVAQAGHWFDGVCYEMEIMGYAIGAAVLPACSVGKDHIRSRLYFVGNADSEDQSKRPINAEASGVQASRSRALDNSRPHGVSSRVAVLRAAGNAIVPQVAAEFIKAAMT